MIYLKEIFIERQNGILRIALKENSRLKECYIEDENEEAYFGQIYKGVVKNIIPAIKCAFVDIGYKKNGYMYMDSKFKNTKIKKGDELVVQVVKEDIGSKGPKVTNAISLPGRYCVIQTLSSELSFSKKIEDEEYKTEISRNIKKPKDVGVMIRTNAVNVTLDIINVEINQLYNIYKDLEKKAGFAVKPGLISGDGGILDKVLRDKVGKDTSKIFVDNEIDYEYINKFARSNIDINAEILLYNDERTIFDYYGIEKEIMNLRNNKVYLECGGFLVINKTEAMYVIDVNSGKNIKASSLEKTAFNTNIQAAEEIVRQIRLRNLTGIIVVDFIDMEKSSYKEEILCELRKGFEEDKSKTTVFDFTELNLVQIARRRVGKPLSDYILENCNECRGRGNRVKLSYLSLLIRNEIIRLDSSRDIKHIHIKINGAYENDIKADIPAFVKDIGGLDKTVYISYPRGDIFKVEPLIFSNQIESLEQFRVYG